MKKKRNFWLVALAVIVLAGGVWLILNRSTPQPVYKGKSLTQWVERHEIRAHGIPQRPSLAVQKIAENAIRAIGTNAIPMLLEWAGDHDSAFKIKFRQFTQWTGSKRLAGLRLNVPPYEYQLRAIDAFSVLRTDAKPAVPALIHLLQDRDMCVQITAMDCIFAIGPSATTEAVPALVNCVTDTNNMVRYFAVQRLGEIHAPPELTVPALISYLDGLKQYHPTKHAAIFGYLAQDLPLEQMTGQALIVLSKYGPEAKAAVPALLPLLKDKNVHIRTMAFATLRAIDPDKANEEDMK